MIHRCFSTWYQAQDRSGTTEWWREAVKQILVLLRVGRGLCPGLDPHPLWRNSTARRTPSSQRRGSSATDGRRKGSFPTLAAQLVSPLCPSTMTISVQSTLTGAWRSPRGGGTSRWAAGGRLRTAGRAVETRWVNVGSRPTQRDTRVRLASSVSGWPAVAPHADSPEGSRPPSCQSSLRCRLEGQLTHSWCRPTKRDFGASCDPTAMWLCSVLCFCPPVVNRLLPTLIRDTVSLIDCTLSGSTGLLHFPNTKTRVPCGKEHPVVVLPKNETEPPGGLWRFSWEYTAAWLCKHSSWLIF